MSNIVVNDLAFAYDNHAVFQEVNFTLDHGFVSVIGPNGAGKSTLIKTINGLYKPRAGQVLIHKQDVHQLNSLTKARLFTTIHQQPHFSFPYTCMEMISHGRYAKSKTKYLSQEDYHVIIDVMKNTDTLTYKDQLITELSGGEQQRVILATALAQEPKIIFIDEGFSALDIHHKTKMIRLLKEYTRSGKMMVVSIMHDLNMVYDVSDQVILMDQEGHVSAGLPSNIMNRASLSAIYQVTFSQGSPAHFHVNI